MPFQKLWLNLRSHDKSAQGHHVRVGSFASVWPDHGDFRYTPVNGHPQDRLACLEVVPQAAFARLFRPTARTKLGQRLGRTISKNYAVVRTYVFFAFARSPADGFNVDNVHVSAHVRDQPFLL
jgi:hypothetical protein